MSFADIRASHECCFLPHVTDGIHMQMCKQSYRCLGIFPKLFLMPVFSSSSQFCIY